MRRTVWSGCLGAALMTLAACAGGAERAGVEAADRIAAPQRAPVPDADFRTESEQFAALQRAALAADYVAFARGLGARDPDAVVAQLTEAFGGAPFDAYTIGEQMRSRDHRRAVELRGTKDRLYLYLELDRSAGGWNVDEYELGRDRGAVTRKL